jgi:proteasome lid subunit RPN8/RPN11
MAGIDVRAVSTEGLAKVAAPSVKHEFRIFFSEEAFDRATMRGAADTTREIGGILVGALCRDDNGPYVRIDTTIDALHAEEKGAELTFTHATWNHINEEMDKKHPDKKIVGWYHTHPGFGIFLSDRDQFIHRGFFNLPHQVALVYDPKSREHGVFAWQDNEPKRCLRYWVGAREHVWMPPQPPERPAAAAAAAPEAPSTSIPAALPRPEIDRFPLFGIGIILALAFGLVGWWLGTGSARDALRKAQGDLDRQRLLGAEEMVKYLNAEMLLALRTALGADALRVPLEDALKGLDEGIAALEKSPPDAGALERVRTARDGLRRLRDAQLGTERFLKQLEATVRAGTVDPQELVRAISRHAAAAGQICVELATSAAKEGDLPRARRLLQLAVSIDPAKREAYERKAAELEGPR